MKQAIRMFPVILVFSCAAAFPATVVSRSIGINNLALYSVAGSASASAARDTIVLSTGSFPGNIGAGDSGIIGAQTFFIGARVDDKTLALASPLAAGASGADLSVFRAYTSIAQWEAAAPADLVSGDLIWKGVCYDDGPFIDEVRIQGSVTDSARYKWLTVAEGQRHTGIIGTGARLCHSYANGSSWSAINIYDDYFHLEWLEVYGEGDRVGNGIAEMNAPAGPGKATINNVIVHDVIFGLTFNANSTRLIEFSNSMVSHTINHAFLGRSAAPSTVRCYNVTMIYGPAQSGSLGGFRYCYAKNCIGFNYGPSNGYANFLSCDPASDYNVSSDASAPGAHSLKSVSPQACVRRLVADSAIDFHLAAGSPAIGQGDSAGCSRYAADMDNETRGSWDIGADMYSTLSNVRPPFSPWVPPQASFLPAFPGCQGWGAAATGGRGGAIIHVTNLNASGAGSFKAACETSGPKMIVVDVSGVIDLANVPVNVTSNTTLFGQTSPAGITLTNGGLYSSGQSNIIIRHIRVRRSADVPDGDCFRFGSGCSRIVIDHCSAMWCSDELIDISYDTREISILNTNLSEPGYCSFAYGGGPGEGLGNNRTAFLGARVDGRVTLWRCVFSQAYGRVPCLTNYGLLAPFGKTFELINNVYYNCMNDAESFYMGNTVPLNLVGNWYRGSISTLHYGSTPPKMYVHSTQNYHYPYPASLNESVQKAYISAVTVKGYCDTFIQPQKTFQITTAAEAFERVIRTVGPLPRDSADRRTVNDIVNGTGKLVDFCDLPADRDPYITTGPARPADTDNDGMPDAWESAHGLNPNLASDAKSDMGGYNAIEAYANSVSDSLENAAMTIPVEGGSPLALSSEMAPSMVAGPNPFTPAARITVRLPARSDVRLAVYDLKGRLVRTLVSGSLGAGSHDFTWRAEGASGLYIVKLTAGNLVLVRRMALVR